MNTRLKKNEREKSRGQLRSCQDRTALGQAFICGYWSLIFSIKGNSTGVKPYLVENPFLIDKNKSPGMTEMEEKLLLCNDWKMRHCSLIIIVRQTQNAGHTDFTWQRLQRKQMPNKKGENNKIRKQKKSEWFLL